MVCLLLALAAAGCATHVGPEGLAVGGPCVDAFDCANGSFCIQRVDYPNGTCTTNCRTHEDCRGDSLCVELEAGVCLLPCDADLDCGREGYTCNELEQRSDPGRVSVCTGG